MIDKDFHKEDYHRCSYIRESGTRCEEPVFKDSKFCFWHDSNVKKDSEEVKKILEAKAKNGDSLEGYNLSYADLDNVYLTHADLRNSILKRANLNRGHLFGVNFSGADLFKADFEWANLKNANLENANILGVNLEYAKLDGIFFGEKDIVLNEKKGYQELKKGDKENAKVYFMEAEEIYRYLKKCFRRQGLSKEEGNAFYNEMVMKKKQISLFSYRRFVLEVADFICGFGEKPAKIIYASIFFIIFNAFIYATYGLLSNGEKIFFSLNNSFLDNLYIFLNSLYFSVVQFTTLGIGDFLPFGAGKFFTGLEAFLGAFMIALFVITFYKKLMVR